MIITSAKSDNLVLPAASAVVAARAIADANRPTGNIRLNTMFQNLTNTPISQGGALLLDKTNLNVYEGQYNLSNALGLDKMGAEIVQLLDSKVPKQVEFILPKLEKITLPKKPA